MTSPALPVLIGGLFAWSLYRRVRRNIGRQPLRPARIIISLIVLSLVTVLLVLASLPFPKMLLGFGAGIVLGAPLGFAGLRLTKFETTEQGHFFKPNIYIGLALTAILIGRMFYRWWVFSHVTGDSSVQPQAFQGPLTYCIFGLTIGYYLVYRTGLFIHTHDKSQTPQ